MSPETAVLLGGLGVAVGAFGTTIGIGGGIILVPVLLLAYPDDEPALITAISLAVVFFNALSGSLAYARLRLIDYRSGVIFALATLPGAALGALATHLVTRRAFDLVFGLALVALAAYLALRPTERKGQRWTSLPADAQRTLTDSSGATYGYAFNLELGIAISFLVGFVASFLGLGGGIIHVPALITLLDFPAHVATATSHFILVFTAFTATLVHIADGALAEGWARMTALAVGAVVGAQAGARLAGRLPGTAIVRLLALALLLAGGRLIAAGLVN